MEAQYILPGELAALVVFLLLPPLLVSLAIQAWIMRRRGLLERSVLRGLVSLTGTIAASIVLATGLILFGPKSLGSFLGVRDVTIGGAYFIIWPIGYFLVPLLAFTSYRMAASGQ